MKGEAELEETPPNISLAQSCSGGYIRHGRCHPKGTSCSRLFLNCLPDAFPNVSQTSCAREHQEPLADHHTPQPAPAGEQWDRGVTFMVGSSLQMSCRLLPMASGVTGGCRLGTRALCVVRMYFHHPAPRTLVSLKADMLQNKNKMFAARYQTSVASFIPTGLV